MKRLYFFICLIMAASWVSAQNFVPTPGTFYNIVQTNSNLVVGPVVEGGFSTTSPAVVTLSNQSSQAFEFIPVPDKPDTYYLLNGEGMYLNKLSGNENDKWSVIFENAANGLFSEWVIAGDINNIRLSNNQQIIVPEKGENAKYLASDNITSQSYLYCDKAIDHVNGLFKLQVAVIDNKPLFLIPNGNIVIEVEEIQPYPIEVIASRQTYDIQVIPSAGFSVIKNNFTPTDFSSNSGKVLVEIMTSAPAGTTGTLLFAYTRGGVTQYLDTVQLESVPTYKRYFIKNKTANLVIGKQSTSAFPALVPLNTEDYQQWFILRPANKGVNDSLYYIIQEGEYRMLRKVASSNWDTEYGSAGNEAIWKIIPQSYGVSALMNFVTKKMLGTDNITPDSRLYDDKTFVVNPTARPYSEWILQAYEDVTDVASSQLSGVSLSTGVLKQNFAPGITTYEVLAPADASVTITATAKALPAFIDGNAAVISSVSPSAQISCVSGDGLSTTPYTFNFVSTTFSDWAARGETSAAKSIPSQWGWRCPNAVWAPANATTSGTCRYIDNPAGYYFLGDTLQTGMKTDTVRYRGRIMYVRWDGAVTAAGVYAFPVMLEAGKEYTFSGRYAWNSVVPSGVTSATLKFGINTEANNAGNMLTSADSVVYANKLMQLNDMTMKFTPATSALYYFTLASDVTLLAGIADMSYNDGTTSVRLPDAAASVYAVRTPQGVNIYRTNAGDDVRVFTASGMLVKQLRANSDITPVALERGIYIIRVNNRALKVVR